MDTLVGAWQELDALAEAWANTECKTCRGHGVIELTKQMCPCVSAMMMHDNARRQ